MKNLLFLLLLTSCVTPKKAVDVLSRPKNEPVAAEFCATKYPVKETYIQGDSIVKYDTLWGVVTDTLISEPQVIVYTDTVRVPKLVIKTITRTDTIKKEDPAKISVFNSQIAELNEANRNLVELNADLSQKLVRISDERDTFKHERNKWKLRFFLLLFGFGLAYALKVKTTKKLF
jgi:FtsZ-binding cell division protein ZapB